MIDSLIIHRQVDHRAEISQGLNLGLWTTSARSSSPENARSKKLSWNIYKYMDTSRSNSATKSLVSSIGVTQLEAAYSILQQQTLQQSFLHNWKTDSSEAVTKRPALFLPVGQPYGASSPVLTDTEIILRYIAITSRNQNMLHGDIHKVSEKNLSVSSSPTILCLPFA